MNEITEITLMDEVAELLEPIDGDSPVGTNTSSVDEYFKLNMEIGKVSPDYKLCVELATTILAEKSKDMRVASWLCFSWFRIDGMDGFKNGLSLLLNLLQKFGDNIYPDNINYRSKAIQYLNSSRFFKLLEKEEITKLNAETTIDAQRIFDAFVEECSKQFPENPPVLKSVGQTINTLCENAEKYVKKNNEVPKPMSNDEEAPRKKDVITEEKNESIKVIKEEKAASTETTKGAITKAENERYFRNFIHINNNIRLEN